MGDEADITKTLVDPYLVFTWVLFVSFFLQT